ncbi:reverse transcriptase domain-containing protein, partial [Tanacetum coccineum]
IGNGRNGCSYKEFVACKPKKFGIKGGAVAYIHWVEKIEYCPNNEMQRLEAEFWSHSMVGASHAAYTDRFHELARFVPHLVTPETKRIERCIYGLAPQIHGMVVATKPLMIQNAILKAVVLTDETVRNRSLKRTGVDPTSIDQIP